MDLRQLRYFVAIVQCGSISRASLQLNIAQPALSLHVRNMEADLGLPLLFRTPQGVQPTEAGLILLRNARLIIEQFEVAQREIRGSVAEPSGEVRLGLPSSISPLLGVPLVLAARKTFPKVTLRIAEAMSGYVLDWLRQGRVDLGLLYGLPDDKDLRATGLLVETLVVFGAPEPPDGRHHPPGDVLPFADLAPLPLILPSPGHGLRDLLDAAAAARGVRLTTEIDIDAYGPSSNSSGAASAIPSFRPTRCDARWRKGGCGPGRWIAADPHCLLGPARGPPPAPSREGHRGPLPGDAARPRAHWRLAHGADAHERVTVLSFQPSRGRMRERAKSSWRSRALHPISD